MRESVWRPTAEEIVKMADSGRDIARFFTNQGTVRQPLTSISGDATQRQGRVPTRGAPTVCCVGCQPSKRS